MLATAPQTLMAQELVERDNKGKWAVHN